MSPTLSPRCLPASPICRGRQRERERLLRRCLERDPKKRLKDIGEAKYYLDEPAASSIAPRRTVLPWLVAAAALPLAAGAYWLRPAREEPVIRSVLPAPEQSIYRCQGDAAGPAVLSPDGKHLAFTAARSDGKVALWVRPLDSAAGQPLAGSEGAMFPFWSPNGQSIGFFADGKLKKVELARGLVSALAEAPLSRGGAWNRDDIIVFAPNTTSVLMRVSASGGAATVATRLDAGQHEISHRWPSFLPDGKHYLYTSRDKGVFLASLDGDGTAAAHSRGKHERGISGRLPSLRARQYAGCAAVRCGARAIHRKRRLSSPSPCNRSRCRIGPASAPPKTDCWPTMAAGARINLPGWIVEETE